ncbi:MAG: CRISPR-associated endonuclease Cas1 [bacterium]
MSTIYIISDFGKLVKNGNVLQLKRENDVLKTIFPFKTEQLVVIGKIDLTGSALRLLMHYNINIIFLGSNGRFNGRINFQEGKNIFLRKKQFMLLDDEKFVLNISKYIVKAKLYNQYNFMQRIKRKTDYFNMIKKPLEKMQSIMQLVNDAENTNQLRGYEGIGAKHYFDVFKYAIMPEWAVFNCRSRMPPKDNVNAVLGFLYTLLLYKVDSAIEISGLDNYVGYFHALDYGRNSLTLDLMEEYRTPIVDTLTVSLFNLGILQKDDFQEVNFNPDNDDLPMPVEKIENKDVPDYQNCQNNDLDNVIANDVKGILLTKEGIKKVIGQFEKKLDTSIYFNNLGKNITYKELFLEQAQQFKRVVNGEESEYKPLMAR